MKVLCFLLWIVINTGDLISDPFNLNRATYVWGLIHMCFESSMFLQPAAENIPSKWAKPALLFALRVYAVRSRAVWLMLTVLC